jgi:tetratricopeptide (TPR) repeat protein
MLEAQAALSNGKGLYSRREFSAAINELNTALSKIRDNSEAYFMRGRSLVETQQSEKAIPDLQRAVALAPRNAEYRILLGSVFESQGQWEDAAEQFAQVSSLGGFGDLTVEALDKKITVLKTRLVLEETVPVSSEAEHDHFIGGCKGTIEMTGDTFYYRPVEKQDHALEVAIERIIRMEARNNELRVVLPGNETFNFKVEDPQKFFSVYEMVKQVLGQPTLGKTPDPEN